MASKKLRFSGSVQGVRIIGWERDKFLHRLEIDLSVHWPADYGEAGRAVTVKMSTSSMGWALDIGDFVSPADLQALAKFFSVLPETGAGVGEGSDLVPFLRSQGIEIEEEWYTPLTCWKKMMACINAEGRSWDEKEEDMRGTFMAYRDLPGGWSTYQYKFRNAE